MKLALALTAACSVGAVSPLPASPSAQERDSADAAGQVIELEPLLVRVLRAPAGEGSPYAVAVAAGRELVRAHAGISLEETVRAVPGVQIQNRYNMAVGERLSIRGHGARAQFGVRGLRVLVDGIPATLPDGQSTLDHLDLGGLSRIEALRGPAASLYGNAAGGVIHVSTLDAARAPTGPATVVRATAGSHGLISLRGEAGRSSGSSAFRIAYAHHDYAGYRRDPIADDGSVYGGGARSVVNAAWRGSLAGGTLKAVANGVSLDALNPGSLSQALLDEGDRQAYRFNVISATGKEAEQGHAGLNWSGALGSIVADVAAWGIVRNVDNPIPGRIVELARNAGGARTLATGVFATEAGTFTLGAGLEYQLQSDQRKNYGNDGGDRTELRLDQSERVHGVSTYAQVRLDTNEGRFSALGGLRYDRIGFRAEDRFTADGWDDSGSRVMNAVSPSFGVVARAGPMELFGSAARSFETPTTSELANRVEGAGGINPELGPQRGATLEGGVRGGAGAAYLEAVVFRTKLTDELVPFEVPSEPGRTYYRNSGSSSHSGVELSMRTSLGEHALLRAAYTRVNARFEEYVPEGTDYSGNRVPGLAPDRLDAVLASDFSSFFAELRGLYQSEVPVDDAGTSSSPAFFLTDLRLGIQELGGGDLRFSPFVSVTNLFDSRYNSSVVVNAFGGRYFEPGPGRSLSVGLEMTFGGPVR